MQDTVDDVIHEFICIARDHLISFYYIRVPERSSALIASMIMSLFSTDAELRLGDWSSLVPYAYFVNEMTPPINWTKKGSVYQFFDKVVEFFQRNAQAWLDYARRRVVDGAY